MFGCTLSSGDDLSECMSVGSSAFASSLGVKSCASEALDNSAFHGKHLISLNSYILSMASAASAIWVIQCLLIFQEGYH